MMQVHTGYRLTLPLHGMDLLLPVIMAVIICHCLPLWQSRYRFRYQTGRAIIHATPPQFPKVLSLYSRNDLQPFSQQSLTSFFDKIAIACDVESVRE